MKCNNDNVIIININDINVNVILMILCNDDNIISNIIINNDIIINV